MRTLAFLFLLALFNQAAPVSKSVAISDVVRSPKIEVIANEFLQKEGTESLSIGIIQGEKEFTFCFGNSCKSSSTPASPESVYEIGSITKVFTGILFADEILKGKLNANDKLVSKLGRYGDKTLTGITLKHLATHSSGLPRMASNFWNCVKDPGNPYAGYSEEDLNSYLRNVNLVHPVGSRYLYSNVGMGILGWVISKENAKPYEELLKERVISPLGLTNTSATLSSEMKRNLAKGYAEGKEMQNWDFQNCTSAQGSLRADMHDMLKFAKANLNPESTSLGDAIRLAQEVHFTDQDNGRNMGFGWHIGGFYGHKYLEHTGGTAGYRSFIGLIPERKIAVIILSNSDKDVAHTGIKILEHIASGNEL